ncbi:hypothetical protein GOV04_00325 [Candidatus Woesearchaeota archaeon]|nr:hypothetical protein [Candidatus Woesearchaeota archaeon]
MTELMVENPEFLKEVDYHIKANGLVHKLGVYQKRLINRLINDFLLDYSQRLGEMYLNIRLKKAKQKFRNVEMMTCSASLTTSNGRYSAIEHDWGAVLTVHRVLEDLKFQVDKKLARDLTKRVRATLSATA